MIQLSTENLRLSYDGNVVVQQLSVSIPSGKISSLIGPNGSGKSTLIRGLARLMRPEAGTVFLDGRAIQTTPSKEVAKQLAMLPQRADSPGGLTVRELVAYGRYPYQGWLGTLSKKDEQQIDAALQSAGIEHLAGAMVGELSGGQRQLAWIAMALAQDTELLLLDEPTTFLDMSHQLEVLEVLEQLNQNLGRTIVMVLHDVNQAARYSDHMFALLDGNIFASGSPTEVLTPENLARVFQIEAEVSFRGEAKVPYCVPIRNLSHSKC